MAKEKFEKNNSDNSESIDVEEIKKYMNEHPELRERFMKKEDLVDEVHSSVALDVKKILDAVASIEITVTKLEKDTQRIEESLGNFEEELLDNTTSVKSVKYEMENMKAFSHGNNIFTSGFEPTFVAAGRSPSQKINSSYML